jgi:MoaA/NifB/PqqE/SkfB family radical SAM enzyme
MDQLDLSVTKKELYEKLKKLWRAEFPTDYRLFVSYNSDVINNLQYPGERLSNFIHILSELDFPTFFVKLSTSYLDVHRDLEHLNSIYNNGIVNVVSSDIDFIIEKDVKDTFCVLPWLHFYFNPQGQINPCCVADINYPLGNFKQDTIDFNSKRIVEFRQTLMSGGHAPQCTTCYKKEQIGLPSLRQAFNQRFSHYLPTPITPVVENFKLRYIDIRLSNLCNLQCRMCSGHFSSKIAAEDFKIWGSSKLLHNSNSTDNEEKLFKLVQDNIESIDHIYFAGGEPLINKFHYDVLDLLIEHNKTDVIIQYNTNFSIIDQSLPYWSKFSNIFIGASIDLCGPAANYVRNGVEYDTILSNYKKLKETCPNVDFKITSVLSIYNIFNLCQLQEEWLKVLPEDKIQFNILTSPENMSITVLPKEIKISAENRINQHIEYLKLYNADKLIKWWTDALTLMKKQDDSHLLKSFFEMGDLRDRARNQVFEDYFPEFQNLRKHAI